MPIPTLGLGATLRSDNPLCCIGCCSSGDVDINVGKKSSDSENNKDVNNRSNESSLENAFESEGKFVEEVITSQPVGRASSLIHLESEIEEQVYGATIDILHSERSNRCCRVIYDDCSSRCMASCGCSACGCSEGECGLGSFGRVLCRIFDACCIGEDGENKLKLKAWYRNLSQRYDSFVISLAEKETGISIQDLFIREKIPSRKEIEILEAACVRAHSALMSSIGKKDPNSWKEEQDKCLSILDREGWSEAIEKSIQSSTLTSWPDLSKVLIVSEGKLNMCSLFSIQEIGKDLSNIQVSTRFGVTGVLGVTESAIVVRIIAEIIKNHPSNRGNFWLTKKDLRCLICLVLDIRNLFFIDTKGNKSLTFREEKIKEIRKRCLFISNSLMLASSTSFYTSQDSIRYRETDSNCSEKGLKEILSPYVVTQLLKRHQEAKNRIKEKKHKHFGHKKEEETGTGSVVNEGYEI